MTKIYIVDEQDQAIGTKERGTLDPADIYRISALWIKNAKGQVLLAQRSLNKKNAPGKWGPAVAGTVEDGETYEANIIKEAEEELGIKGVEFEIGPKEFVRSHTVYFCQWFFATIDRAPEDFVLQEEEVEQVKWYDAQELPELIRDHPDDFTYGMSIPERQQLLGLD